MFFPNSSHLKACGSLRILVVGDVMLDHYLRGSVERTSPEAPVPVLRVESEDYILGGAANVAHNLAAMGAKAELASVCGRDPAAKILFKRLREAGISAKGVVEDSARPTTLKTRALAQGQQMLRIDWERSQPIAAETQARLLAKIRSLLDEVQGVIVSDYGKGVLTNSLLDELVRECSSRGLQILADPKGLDYSRYKGISILTPNVKEAQAAAGLEVRDEESLRAAADRLNRQVQGRAICITRGSQGVSVFPKRGEPIQISAIPREVFDVTGAGDTFISHLALGLFQGLGLFEAASWANLAAGIVVERLGVAVVTPAELISEAGGDRAIAKVRSLADLETAIRDLRAAGKKIVFTNGCFDFLHVGHLRLIEAARQLGDCLIVAINSDDSVRKVKGPPRPLLPERERASLLASLHAVDIVTIFQETTPDRLLRRIKPDVLAKGGNLEPGEIVGREIVEGYGGEVRILPAFGERSISQLLERWAQAGLTNAPSAPPAAGAARAKSANSANSSTPKRSAKRKNPKEAN